MLSMPAVAVESAPVWLTWPYAKMQPLWPSTTLCTTEHASRNTEAGACMRGAGHKPGKGAAVTAAARTLSGVTGKHTIHTKFLAAPGFGVCEDQRGVFALFLASNVQHSLVVGRLGPDSTENTDVSWEAGRLTHKVPNVEYVLTPLTSNLL